MAATAVNQGVETSDVQGLVLQGYGRLRAAAYVVLEITDGQAAREWLRGLLPELSFGEERPAARALNLALTAAGLTRLGLPTEVTAGFSLEFVEGVASAHRSRLLGDEGQAAPAHWTWGGPDGPEVHALLLAFAHDEDTLTESLTRVRSGLADGGLREVVCLTTTDIGRGEHFGFRDGLSQPTMSGVGSPGPSMHTVAPGEFLLGYPNEHGQYPRSPLGRAVDDPDRLLPRRTSRSDAASAPVAADLQ
ncbi:MAG: hypothetical protein ABWY19_11775, partial [Marmoricola sp.]